MKKINTKIKLVDCRICRIKFLFFFAGGAALLSLFSLMQKLIAGYPVQIKGFIVPVLFGGATGIILGIEFIRINRYCSALNNAHELIKSIIDSMPAEIIAVDSSLIVTLWNNQAELSTEKSAEYIVGKPVENIVKYISDEPDKIIEKIKTGKIEKWTTTKKMDTVHENIIVYPLSDRRNEGAVIMITDLTKEYRLQEQLNHSRKMDVIGQLAQGVAHDFNNMLGGIMGAAQMLKISIQNTDEKLMRYINLIIESSERAANLTSKLLTLGRKNGIKNESFELHKIINDAVDILKQTLDKRISISFTDRAENHVITGNRTELQSALMNLGINSSHAMRNGGEIIIETENIILSTDFRCSSLFDIIPGEYIKTTFQDTGTGIPEDIINKIFEPFFTTKKEGIGSGLGLTAVYETIKNHHGFIDIESKAGEGTVFYMYLPCGLTDK